MSSTLHHDGANHDKAEGNQRGEVDEQDILEDELDQPRSFLFMFFPLTN